MVETQTRLGLVDVFPDSAVDLEPSHEKGALMVQAWGGGLVRVVDALHMQDELAAEVAGDIKLAIEMWENENPERVDHGAWHSYFVYEGMRDLARQEERLGELDDSMLQALPVLHDLVQGLPFVHPTGGRGMRGNQRKQHARVMAALVKGFGGRLGLSEVEIEVLATSIKRHDEAFEGRIYSDTPYEGQLLSDADKLYGSSLERNAVGLAKGMIARNRQGGVGRGGWYTIRREINTERGDRWKYGDRWAFDRLRAVRAQVFRMPMYTEAGRAAQEGIKGVFVEQARDSFGDEFDQVFEQVSGWIERPWEYEVSLAGRGRGGRVWRNEVGEGEPVVDVIKRAYETPLQLEEKYRRLSDMVLKGWKVVLTKNGQEEVIDPSIALYAFDKFGERLDQDRGRQLFVESCIRILEGSR